MIDNFLYSVLPFYDSLDKQNFKKEWCFADIYSCPLISPKNRFLPFEITRSNKYNPLTSLKLFCYNNTLMSDYLPNIPAGDIDIVSTLGLDYLVYYGNKDLTQDLPCGYYYLEMYDGIQTWWSEIFKVVDFEFIIVNKLSSSSTSIPSTPKPYAFNISAQDIISLNKN